MTCPRRPPTALLPVLALQAFSAAAPRRPRRPSRPLPPARDAAPAEKPLSNAIRWTRDSAEHRALFLQVYRAATAHVEQEAARAPAAAGPSCSTPTRP